MCPKTATSVSSASHSDLRIEGNIFDTGPGPTLLLNDVADVVVTANAITRCGTDGSNLLNSTNAAGVRVYGNKVQMLDTPRLCAK